MRLKISPVVGKEGFNKIVKRGAGHVAEKAKREEYERLMRRKKKTPPAFVRADGLKDEHPVSRTKS